MGLQQDN